MKEQNVAGFIFYFSNVLNISVKIVLFAV